MATSIVRRNEKFSNDVWKKGHTIDFDQTPRESSPSPEPSTSDKDDGETDDEDVADLDLADLIHKSPERTETYEEIMSWLKKIYTSSRGFELGTFDTALIPLLWKKQSVNWDDLALGYISDVMVIVHRFISCLLRAICPDERVLRELTSVLMEELVTRYHKAIDQVKFILRVERAGTPLTLNHYFNENLEKW